MRASIVVGFIFSLGLGFGASACGAALSGDDDLAAEPVVLPARADVDDERAKADGLRTYVIRSVAVPSSRGTTETRKVFTTLASFKSFFGQGAQPPVDFSRRWLAFYSAGMQRTGGYAVSIPLVSLSASGKTLEVTTRLDSPGEGCIVTQATTKPTALVSFAKPTPAPGAVRYYKSDRKPAACIAGGLCGDPLSRKLQLATAGLLWMSESDYPFATMTVPAVGADPITEARLRSIIGIPRETPVAQRTLDATLAWVTSEAFAAEDDSQRELALRYRQLKALLEENLRDIQVWKVGTIEVRVYFLGKTSCGELAGLFTTSIET